MAYNTNTSTSETHKADKKRLKQILDAGNVAEILDDDELGRLGSQVLETYGIDESDPDRAAKQEKWTEGQKIVKQIVESKNTPFENASNVKYPLLTTACIQFNARSYPAVIRGNAVIRPQMVGGSKAPEVPEPQEGMPPEALQKLEELKAMAEKFKDKQKKADRACEYMNWQLFNELAEWEEDSDRLLLMLPLYGDMFRKIWNSKSKRRLESKLLSPEHLIFPANAASIDEAPRISELFTLYPNQIAERIRQGDFIPFTYHDDRDEAHEFIEQHCWYDLDEDGYKEPYIVIVHKPTGNVCQVLCNFEMKDVLKNSKGEVSSIKPIKHYIHYQFIPSSDGSIYGLGFFDILFPINAVIDTTINQLLDAGNLANSNMGFIGKEAQIGQQNIRAKIGEYVSVPVRGDDIRKGMVQMQFPGPSPGLFQLLGFMVEAGREIANIKDVLLGEQRPNQTATATLALIEQGTKVFSAIHKRIFRAMKREFEILRQWNIRVLDRQKYEAVTDAPVQVDDFDDAGYDFIPVADPEVATDMQRMGRAEFLLTFRGDPYVNQAEIRKRVFAAANIEDVDELMQEPSEDPEAMKQTIQQLQQALQQMQGQLQGVGLKFKTKELELKEREVAMKELTAKASAVESIANAESKEAGRQIEQYKIDAGVSNDKRRGVLELAKLAGNRMGVRGNEGPPGAA